MILNPKIGFIAVFHPFEEGADDSQDLFQKCLQKLENLDIDIITTGKAISTSQEAEETGELFRQENIDVIVVLLATWSSDNLILDIVANCDVPVINWGMENINSGSMCGAQQYNAVLKELNKISSFVYKNTESALDEINKVALIHSIKNRLKKIKLGIIGNRTQGMAEVICDEYSLKEVLGPRVVSLSLDQLKQMVIDQDPTEISNAIEEIKNKFQNIKVSSADLEDATRNLFALRQFIEDENLEGVTIECYPNYMGKVCLAFNMLSDNDIIGACEADLNSAALMWIMQQISKMSVLHIDLLTVIDKDNSIIGSHCGCGSNLIAENQDEIVLENVRLAKNGVCVTFPAKPGRVTIANLIGRKGTYRLGIVTGEAVKTKLVFPGNPIRIRLPFPNDIFLSLIDDGGFGHHWVVAYGDIAEELVRLANVLNLDTLYFNLKLS
jgi:L-fucose isomerase-like protein